MIEKFKAFLAGKPYWFDEARRAEWSRLIATDLPWIIREWYDSTFDVAALWLKDSEYYGDARKKLAGNSQFKRDYSEYNEILQIIKLLADFFAEEKRKAGLGRTVRKLKRAAAPSAPSAPPVEVLEEGEIKAMHIAKHERNPALRRACIEYYRAQNGGRIACAACGMSFGEIYGDFGEGYIEVHHLSPISQTEGTHQVNPQADLVTLCANCHAMIHRLMSAEQRATGTAPEGAAALAKLRARIGAAGGATKGRR